MEIRINVSFAAMDADLLEFVRNPGGGADNNIQIVIRLSWDTEEGTGSQEFVFNDDVVAQVYSSNDGRWSGYGKQFTMVITGFESITNLKANMVVISGTNTEYASSQSLSIT